jgi:hypothetical protein
MVPAKTTSCALFLLCLTGCALEYRPMEPFSSKEGNFNCVFPGGTPNWRKKPWSFPPIQVAEGLNPGIEYAAGYGDGMVAPRIFDLPKIYSEMEDKVLADFKGKTLYSGDVWVDGYKGIEFVMKLPAEDGRICKMRAMIAGKRAYMFGVVCARADLNAADVHRFFASFKLIEKPAIVFDPIGSTFDK